MSNLQVSFNPAVKAQNTRDLIDLISEAIKEKSNGLPVAYGFFQIHAVSSRVGPAESGFMGYREAKTVGEILNKFNQLNERMKGLWEVVYRDEVREVKGTCLIKQEGCFDILVAFSTGNAKFDEALIDAAKEAISD